MRIKISSTTRKRRKKILKLAKGYWGHKSIGFKVAKQQVAKSFVYAFRDRKQVKREFRKLWITRINAGVKEYDLSYSRFMNGIKKAEIQINRKMLSEIAINYQPTFKKIVDIAKLALAKKQT